MPTPEQREVAQHLLDNAKGDLHAVETLASDDSQSDRVLGLLAQQAVEKSLKSVLVAFAVEIPLTHDLAALAKRVRAAGVAPPEPLEVADWLTPWAGPWRYGHSGQELDRDAALAAARAAVDWAQGELRSS